jgi:hypothetical protein
VLCGLSKDESSDTEFNKVGVEISRIGKNVT